MTQCARTNGHCKRCEGELPFEFSMAFQPIVNLDTQDIHAYEALVRGVKGESAGSIISQVSDELLYLFDQACRVRAIEIASDLGMNRPLSINFLPNAVYEPKACIQATLDVSERVGWSINQLIFEITETERVRNRQHINDIIEAYKSMGFSVALDDFGNGYANLDLLTDLSPDKLKIDRQLVMNCHRDVRRQALLRALVSLGNQLGMILIAEGVETIDEAVWLYEAGINLQQGFLFARPAFESLATGVEGAMSSVYRRLSPRSIATLHAPGQ